MVIKNICIYLQLKNKIKKYKAAYYEIIRKIENKLLASMRFKQL